MTLTKNDLQSIKSLLDAQKTGIIEEVRAVETKLAAKIDKLRDETTEAIGDLADQIAIQKEVDNLTKRVEKLERLQRAS